MISYFNKTSFDEEFKAIDMPSDGCWIHVDEASNEDLTALSYISGLDFSDLHDSLDKYEVPRLEKINQNVLIFTRYPTDLEAGLYTSTLTFILTPNHFITISPQKSFLIRSFLGIKSKLTTQEKPKLLLHLMLKILHEFTSQIKRVRHNVLKQEKELSDIQSEDIASLAKNEEILSQYSASLSPLRHVLETITSGKYTALHEDDQDLLEDLVNAIKQSEDLCNITMKSIRSLRDSYQTIFTNNSQKTIKLLTALTIIFSFPTMIASLYGMNVALPLENTSLAFVYIIFFIILVSLIGLYIFHRKKWL